MQIKNPEDLTRAFKKLDQLTQTRYLSAAVTAGMMPIQNRVIDLAPRVTSTYVRSIHHEIAIAQPDYCEGVIGTNLPYGMRLEFGFNDTDSLGREYHQPAQPHWRPAFDEKRGEAVQEMGDSLNDILMSLIG
jgi:hypothetical protein